MSSCKASGLSSQQLFTFQADLFIFVDLDQLSILKDKGQRAKPQALCQKLQLADLLCKEATQTIACPPGNRSRKQANGCWRFWVKAAGWFSPVEMHPVGKRVWADREHLHPERPQRKTAYEAIAWDPVRQPYFYAQMHPKI